MAVYGVFSTSVRVCAGAWCSPDYSNSRRVVISYSGEVTRVVKLPVSINVR